MYISLNFMLWKIMIMFMIIIYDDTLRQKVIKVMTFIIIMT